MPTLDPERWSKVSRLYDEVVEMDGAERVVYLEKACAGDPGLRAEVERLVASEEEMGAFLERPAGEGAGTLMDRLAQDETPLEVERAPGSRIGPWRVLREVGRGGMGVVYEVERADGQYERRAALKVIKRGMDTDEILKRFLTERRILARLDHPHIAALYDGGLTDDGLPYFALEYVEGEPITVYCDRLRLGVDERLGLFVKVCDAVRYAQRSLVVHRDIKPGNILVTTDGRVKLLDFGIAKVLGAETGGPEAERTRTGQRFMSPAYAAPEQFSGSPVTTATDVYSLGAVLFEVLTGRRTSRAGFPSESQAVATAAIEDRPDRPSAAIRHVRKSDRAGESLTPESIARARRTVPRQLERRLRGDLDTLVLKALNREPERRYPSAEALLEDLERYRRGAPLAARPPSAAYRIGKFVRRHRIGVAAAGLLLLAILLGLGGTTAGLVRARRAERKALQEAETSGEVTAFLTGLFKTSNPEVARGNAITAREILDKGAERIDHELADRPLVQSALMQSIGDAYESLGLFDRAVAIFEKTVALRSKLLGKEHPDTLGSLNSLGAALLNVGREEESERVLRDVVATETRVLGPGDLTTIHSARILAGTLLSRGRSGEAERLYRRNYDTLRAGNDPDREETWLALGGLAHALVNQGKLTEAEPLLKEALAGLDRLLGKDHPKTMITRNQLGYLLLQQGKLAESEAVNREILAIQTRVVGPDHIDTLASVNNVGGLAVAQGRAREAEPMLRDGLLRAEQHLPKGHWLIATLRFSYGECLGKLDRFKEAEALMLRSYAETRAVRGREADLASMAESLADLYRRMGKPAEAARYMPPPAAPKDSR